VEPEETAERNIKNPRTRTHTSFVIKKYNGLSFGVNAEE